MWRTYAIYVTAHNDVMQYKIMKTIKDTEEEGGGYFSKTPQKDGGSPFKRV